MFKSKLFAVAALTAFCSVPMLAAQDRDDHARQQQEQRMYDAAHKDYHTWNADEDRRYHEYVTENHMKYREFSKLGKRKQKAYWQWRHEHEDHR